MQQEIGRDVEGERKVFVEHPGVETRVFLARKCIALNERLEALNLQNIRTRLVQHLLRQCPVRAPYHFELKDKKMDIAKQLGTISETLSRNLRQLQAEKLIKVEGKAVTILNYPALRRLISA